MVTMEMCGGVRKLQVGGEGVSGGGLSALGWSIWRQNHPEFW